MCNVPQRPEDQVDVSAFIDELVVAIVSHWMYSLAHPRVQGSLKKVLQLLDQLTDEESGRVLRIGVADGYLFHNKRPLLSATLSAPRIMQVVEEMDGGGLEFTRGSTLDDLGFFLEAVHELRGTATHYIQANQKLSALGCDKIRFLPPYGYGDTQSGPDPEGGDVIADAQTRQSGTFSAYRAPVQVYKGVVNHLQAITVSICRGKRLDISTMASHIENIMRRLETDPIEMQNLSRYDHLDAFTFGHSVRVCFLALHFAKALTDDTELLRRIGLASLLHDVGKAHVPFEILHSTNRLSPEERTEMEKHSTLGALTLLELTDPDPIAIATAFGHHRSQQKNGYPKVDHWIPISKITELIKICDVYEALTAARPYKAPMHPVKAYRIMLSMGEHFDRALLRRFIDTNGIFPVGTLVALSDGSRARVEHQTTKLLRPLVRVQTTPDGDALDDEDQRLVDLAEASEAEFQDILGGPEPDQSALPA